MTLSLGGQAARLPHTTDVHPGFPTALRSILGLTDLMVAPRHLGHSLECLPDGIIGEVGLVVGQVEWEVQVQVVVVIEGHRTGISETVRQDRTQI